MNEIKSPKAGKVFNISIKIGDYVEKDQEILDIEAKKGNFSIKSPFSGIVETIHVPDGAEVKMNDLLVSVIAEPVTAESAQDIDSEKPITKLTKDVVIIGGGPGGYVAAIKAAQLGLDVALVEKNKLGGTCLNIGCIPTKALVRSAEVFESIKAAADYGLGASNPIVNMERVINWKDEVVKRLVEGVYYLIEQNKITLVEGIGSFLDEKTVFVSGETTCTELSSKNIIIATGSEVTHLAIPGNDANIVLTSTEILDLTELPEKLAIIGGGVIGMEFAFIYTSFGVEVTVIEFMDHVLGTLDTDIITEIEAAAEHKGITLYTGARLEEVMDTTDNKGVIRFTQGGRIHYLAVDKVLMAVGRKPHLDGLQLEKAGVTLDEKTRGIKVNAKMETTTPGVYAIGDATNIVQLAHVASHQGLVAVENIAGVDKTMDYRAVPSAIFTHPEIATVGLTEKVALAENLDVEIGKFPYAANGKALATGDERGFIKVIKDKATDCIVGAALVGINAADLIAPLTLAIQNKLTTEQIIETIFAHPTTAEVIHEGVLTVAGGALHYVE